MLYTKKDGDRTMDVTSQALLLGNPFNKSTFAKNVWDMQVYHDRIYLGHGDFNTDAGPIPVIYFDACHNEFVTHFTVDEEEIHHYKVLNDKLYIPGTDARDDWSFGNYYTLEDNDLWLKHRTIPNAAHVFDMSYYNGRLYAATGTTKPGWGEVFVSDDFGQTWQSKVPKLSSSSLFTGDWATTFFELNEQLYASGKMIYPPPSIAPSMARYTNLLAVSPSSSYVQSYTKSFAPLSNMYNTYYIQRPTTFKNLLVFFNYKSTASHWMPDSMYVAADLTHSQKITFPQTTAIPSDLLERNGLVYVLAYDKNSSGNFTNIIYESQDLFTWSEVFRFNTETFARSFEELYGDFYFGLGCDYGSSSQATGNILKVCKFSY